MANDSHEVEQVPRLENPDPFSLPRQIRKRLGCCAERAACGCHGEVEYLWIHAGRGADQSRNLMAAPNRLTEEQWLNVVDEAASLGVTWVVVSVTGAFSSFQHVWRICAWAQRTHGMQVGLHTTASTLTDDDIAAIQSMDLEKTSLFAHASAMRGLEPLERAGVTIMKADPSPTDAGAPCRMPGKMVFVNAEGVLYTCGVVTNKDAYRLGTIHERTFERIMQDPALPHAVPYDDREKDDHGCDGCPPLVLGSLLGRK